MSAVATWRGWHLFFVGVNSRSENLNHARRLTGLDKLVEGGNDSRDYPLTTLFIGREKLPVELPAFCRSTYLSVGRKLATDSDSDIQCVVV